MRIAEVIGKCQKGDFGGLRLDHRIDHDAAHRFIQLCISLADWTDVHVGPHREIVDRIVVPYQGRPPDGVAVAAGVGRAYGGGADLGSRVEDVDLRVEALSEIMDVIAEGSFPVILGRTHIQRACRIQAGKPLVQPVAHLHMWIRRPRTDLAERIAVCSAHDVIHQNAEGAYAAIVKRLQLFGEAVEIFQVIVGQRRDRVAEIHAGLRRDVHRFRELVHDLGGIELLPAGTVLAVVLRTIDVEVETMLPDEANKVVTLGKGVIRTIKSFDHTPDTKR